MLDLGPNTLDEALAAAQRYESNHKVLNKGSARVLSSTSGDQEKFGSQQGTQEPPAWAKELFQQQAEILEKLKNIPQGRQCMNACVESGQGPRACFKCGSLTHFIRDCPHQVRPDQGNGRWAGPREEVTPPENPKGAFLPCAVNGVKSQALLDTGAEATIISEDLYSRSKTHLNKLELTQKPVLGANNMPLDVVGKAEVTIQLGGIRAQHKVLVCPGLVQKVLIGIDCLTAHKCIINFDTNTVYSKGEPNKIVFGCLDKVYRITVAETVTFSPNMVADIPCEVQGIYGLDECMGVLEPVDTFSEKYSAGAFRMAVTVKGGRIPSRLFNYLNKSLKIYRCSSIGDLYPLAGEGESQQETNGCVGYKVVPPGAPKEDVEVGLEAKQCSAVFVKDPDVHSLSVEEMFPISSNFVPEEGKLRLYDMLSTYADCISKGPWDLGTAKGVRHTINTGSAQPIQVPPRRVPFHKRQEMRSQVDEMLEADIIEPSDSPWYSPVVLVAKPDGSQRFCVDYRALNSVTKRDLYPLPRCDDILESLSGAQWFSHLDLLRGYWQIDVAEKDREKTAFATLGGLYQFRKLSFGLTNAPAGFMRAMHLILRGLCWSDCLVYLDDIIVFGRTLQEYRERLSLVLSRLTEAGLKINPKKCKLLCEQVVVLGHVVSGKGISTDPEKIRVIKEWPVPADESQLRVFLGTVTIDNSCQTTPTLHPLCTVLAKRGTALDGQLSARKPSCTLSAN